LRTTAARKPRTVCGCQSVTSMISEYLQLHGHYLYGSAPTRTPPSPGNLFGRAQPGHG
jgi:hypothetical protein